jgi:hypothetical protein
MAGGEDFAEKVVRQAREAGERREQDDSDLKPSEELIADAGMRRRELELLAKLEQARAEEARFEARYGVTFGEFQAAFDPQADEQAGEDYLAWSRAAEQVRMSRHELARLQKQLPRRGGRPPAPADESDDDPGARPRGRVS